MNRTRSLLPAALALVLAGFLAGRRAPAPALERPVAAEEAPPVERRDATVRAIERVSPAVANISTERVVVARDPFFGAIDIDEFFKDIAPPRRMRQTSLGSGVVIDPEGYVVTNAHVVARATAIQVSLPGAAPGTQREYAAVLVNISPENDLALLKIEPAKDEVACGLPRFPTARLARANDAIVGETVIALGNPFGLGSTVTRGVLSAKERAVEGASAKADFLQTDAAINPGNSGGPLVNLAGEVIGINSAIYAQARGIGFAIPVGRVRAAVCDLLDERELTGRSTGLRFSGGPDDRISLAVSAVDPGSPAAKAGVEPGWAVRTVNGDAPAWAFAVKKRLCEARPDEAVRLSFSPGAGLADREVALTPAPPPALPGEKLVRERLGLRVKPISNLLAERAGLADASGVLVVRADEAGPGGRAGLQAGDVIARVGVPQPGARGFLRYEVFEVRGLDDLAAILEHAHGGDRLLLFVRRDGRELRGEVELK
jgi:S1-C subfamily serine protease